MMQPLLLRTVLHRVLAAGLCCAALTATGAPAEREPLASDSQKVYEARVKPFLQANCVRCHNDKVTRAGFRIDTLGTDFLAGKTADYWKEIYDKIGNGKMPPEGTHNSGSDSQAQTDAGDAPLSGMIRAEEGAEQMRNILGFNTDASIFQVEHCFGALLHQPQLDRRAGVADLEGIIDEVAHGLIKELRMDMNMEIGFSWHMNMDVGKACVM